MDLIIRELERELSRDPKNYSLNTYLSVQKARLNQKTSFTLFSVIKQRHRAHVIREVRDYSNLIFTADVEKRPYVFFCGIESVKHRMERVTVSNPYKIPCCMGCVVAICEENPRMILEFQNIYQSGYSSWVEKEQVEILNSKIEEIRKRAESCG